MIEYAGRGDAARTMDLLWGDRPAPARRGPRQRVDVEHVVATAIAIADAEGLDALSMRRLAEAAGVPTMSIYTHLHSKAELLELMVDRAIAASDLPAVAVGWRSNLESQARASWSIYRRHPWLLDISTVRTVFGPHVIARYEAALAMASTVGLAPRDVVAVVSLVDGYARGAARAVVDAERATAQTGLPEADWWIARASLLEARIAEGNFPTMMALGAAGAFDAPDTGVDYMVQRAIDEFEFGLARILDGIAALIT
jgi:AcrR family transcriptional regulator